MHNRRRTRRNLRDREPCLTGVATSVLVPGTSSKSNQESRSTARKWRHRWRRKGSPTTQERSGADEEPGRGESGERNVPARGGARREEESHVPAERGGHAAVGRDPCTTATVKASKVTGHDAGASGIFRSTRQNGPEEAPFDRL